MSARSKLIRLVVRRNKAFTFRRAVLMLLCPLEVSCSRSVISSKGALMSVSGVRISCAVLTKKRIFSSDSFRCFLKAMIRRAMLAMDMIITA